MEAIQIRLKGELSNSYDVYYRVHVGDVGWLGWTKNGEMAGSTGCLLKIEAIEIKLCLKGNSIETSQSYIEKPVLKTSAYVKSIGWQTAVTEGEIAGTTGQAKRIEKIKINCSDFFGKNGILYRVHVQDEDWHDWKTTGKSAGTTGKQIEAIEIKLTGSIAAIYDVYYRVHCQDFGWLGWSCNGETAGTTGGGKQMEAIQIQLVRKGQAFDRGGLPHFALGNMDIIEDGYYQIKSAIDNNYVLDVYKASIDNGTNVQIYQNGGGTNQGFLIKKQSDGYYTIKALHSNKFLDVANNGTSNGTNIVQYQGHGGDNQLWKIYKTSDGYYSFQSKSSGLFLDISGGTVFNENNIQIWENNGTLAQKFELRSVTLNGKAYQEEHSLSKQEQVVNYLNECATIAWKPQTSFIHWSGGRTWEKNTTYYGIPYSQASRNTTLEQFKQNMIGNSYVGPAGQKTYLGSDCSSAVSMAYRTVNDNFPITATYYMFPSYSYMKKVGNYNDGNLQNSKDICTLNGRNKMYEAYKALQPGDLLLETNHVMMVTEVGDSYVKVTHQTTFSSALSSTWRVNEKWTYRELYNSKYIPVTMREW